jgi:GLPGLI family protein
MKRIATVFALCLPLLSLGQKDHGRVEYKQTMNIELDEGMEQFRAMIEESTTSEKELLFTKAASLYRTLEVEEEEEIEDGNNEQIMMVMDGGESVVYTDHEAGVVTEQTDVMGKKFLIKGPEKDRKWKIHPERKKVQGYDCQRAVFTDSMGTLEAWFASDIPVSAGPMGVGKLPGLILELNLDDQMTVTATKVEFAAPDKKEMKAPKGGKEVTRDEYEEIMAERSAEMQDGEGHGGGMQIRIEVDEYE